jgi:serine/threonine protein kinase
MQAPQEIAQTAVDPENKTPEIPIKAVSSSAEYIRILEQSRLVSAEVLHELRAFLRKRQDTKPTALAAKLVRDRHLTAWQSQQLLAGKTQFFLGRYKFLDRLGVGGMGAVFKAEHEIMGRIVALKMIRRRMLEDEKTRERFLREIRATAKLTDPNIVNAYDADRVGDVYFLVMEYVDGKDLGWWVQQNGPFPSKWACEFCRQTALGLQHAHECGLVHRDIKPTNLLAVREPAPKPPSIKILDFGLSHLATDDQEFEANSAGQLASDRHVTSVVGTFGFMAPEQFNQPPQSDIRTDIFSLGCTLFYLLTGQLPYSAETDSQYIASLRKGERIQARALKPSIPVEVEAVLDKSLAANPDDRYKTPREFADALWPLSAKDAQGTAATAMPSPLPSKVVAQPETPRHLQPSVDAALGEFDVELTSGPADIFIADFSQATASQNAPGTTSLPSPFDYSKRRRGFFATLVERPLLLVAIVIIFGLLVVGIVSCSIIEKASARREQNRIIAELPSLPAAARAYARHQGVYPAA